MKCKEGEKHINTGIKNEKIYGGLKPVELDLLFSENNLTKIISKEDKMVILLDCESKKIRLCFSNVKEYTIVDSFYVFDTVYDEKTFYKYYDEKFKNVIYRIVGEQNMEVDKFLVVTGKYFIEIVTNKDFEYVVL